MVNYGNGKIYKIVRLSDDELIYVGSTTKHYLSSRLVEHKNMSKRCPNRKVYKSINENGGWKNHAIILIEHCNCNSKDELHRKERDFIACFKPIGNNAIPLRTRKEYYIDNIEKFEQHNKQYYIENKEKFEQRNKQYYIENKEKLKQYYIENKEKIKQYYINNIEKINQKIQCQCGKTYTHQNRLLHNKSKFHINNTPKPDLNIV